MTTIGAVIIHRRGANPYLDNDEADNPYCTGQRRAEALQIFHDTGKLPVGFILWDDVRKVKITSPKEIDWQYLKAA